MFNTEPVEVCKSNKPLPPLLRTCLNSKVLVFEVNAVSGLTTVVELIVSPVISIPVPAIKYFVYILILYQSNLC